MIKFLKNLFTIQSSYSTKKLNTGIQTNNKTIFFITGGIPTFDKDSGSNRLTQITLGFKELGYQCSILVTSDDLKESTYSAFFTENNIKIYFNSDINAIIKILKSVSTIDYFWFYGPNTYKKYFKIINNQFPETETIYDMIDIHHLRFKRSIDVNPSKISTYKKYVKYKKIELNALKNCDILITISELEKEYMQSINPNKKILVVSNIHFNKLEQDQIPSFKKKNDLLFIGSDHDPNIDAIHYLYNEIMPIVWKTNPSIKVTIIGNLDEKIKNISHPNFKFLGFVENIEPYFLNSKFMIAPLRYGAGVKGKIGQAYEYFLPVITTNIGAEGMNLIHNQNALIANNANTFADAILKLYDDETLWNKLSDASSSVLNGFSKNELHKTLSHL